MISKTSKIKISISICIFLFSLFTHFYLLAFYNFFKELTADHSVLLSLYNTYIAHGSLFSGLAYGIISAFAVYCLINLMLAENLKRSIRGLKLSGLLWLIILFILNFDFFGNTNYGLQNSSINVLIKFSIFIVTLLIIISAFYFLISFKKKFHRKPDYTIVDYDNISTADNGQKINPYSNVLEYTQLFLPLRILRYIFLTIFRLFPSPARLGIYKFGNPDKDSPVFVTSNYTLTVEKVAKFLKSINAYLLVADGKGVNVWCSSGAGHFNNQSIIDAIELSGLKNIVQHRRIILPQFSAVNIIKKELEKETTWKYHFGPVNIKDIQEYIDNIFHKTVKTRTVDFPILKRIEMSIGSPIITVAVLTLVLIFINPKYLLYTIPIVYLQSLIYGMVQPYLKIKSGLLVGIFYAAFNGAVLFIINQYFLKLSSVDFFTLFIPLIVSSFYLPNEFLGWSPLIKYNLSTMVKGYSPVKIKIDTEKCTGCSLCIDVCPVNVYQMIKKKSFPARIINCESCTACFKQCPVSAIEHSIQDTDEGCACAYCTIHESIK